MTVLALLVATGCGPHPLAPDFGDTTVVYRPALERSGERTAPAPIVYTTVADSPHLAPDRVAITRKLDEGEMEFLLDSLLDAGLDDVPEADVLSGSPGPQSITIESAGVPRRWDGRSPALLRDAEARGAFTRATLVLIQHSRSEYKIEARRE